MKNFPTTNVHQNQTQVTVTKFNPFKHIEINNNNEELVILIKLHEIVVHRSCFCSRGCSGCIYSIQWVPDDEYFNS